MRGPETPAPPGQSLALSVECASQPGVVGTERHRVVIREDWSVETQHDLDAERVGRSMGGWCGCLHLVEHVLPPFRGAILVMTDPGVLPFDGNRWSIEPDDPEVGMMASFRYTTLGAAVRQAISPEQLIGGLEPGADDPIHEYEHRHLRLLFERAGSAWAHWGDPTLVENGTNDYLDLWQLGILPTHVEEIARGLPRGVRPLSAGFYREAHYTDIDAAWLSSVVTCYPIPDFAEWAVSQQEQWRRLPADMVWRMFELGVSAEAAIEALEERVPIEQLTELANRPGVHATSAARWLAGWARLGVMPTSAHYRLLEAEKLLVERLPTWLLEGTIDRLRRLSPDPPSRTETAMMLTVLQDSPALLDTAVELGIREATDLRFIQLAHQARPEGP